MKNHYALHPVICENDFFKEWLQKDANGEFKQNKIATAILGLYEITAMACWQKAVAAYYKNYFAHAIALFECAELVYEYLTKKQNRQDLENDYATMLINKGEAFRQLTKLNEAVKNFDLAINILKQLVEIEGQTELAYILAIAYMNKGVALFSLGKLNEAIKNLDLAINILKSLVKVEGRKELANDLAMAYMNKGSALYSLGSLNEAIKNYDLAINIRKPLVEVEGRKELANYLAIAYGNKALVLEEKEDWDAALVCYENALKGLAFCYEQSGMYWHLPELLKWLRGRLRTLLDLERWQNAAQDVSRFLSLFASFIERPNIHDELKESAIEELAAMIDFLCRQPKENREKIYDACGDNAEMVRETVEGFCKQKQEQ